MTAEEARKITQESKQMGHNYQRLWALEQIKNLSKRGKNRLVLSDPCIHFFDDDYAYFESLGYKVTRDRLKPSSFNANKLRRTFGVIEW